jgi:hypothetical protein
MERAVVGMLIRPQKTFDERTPALLLLGRACLRSTCCELVC